MRPTALVLLLLPLPACVFPEGPKGGSPPPDTGAAPEAEGCSSAAGWTWGSRLTVEDADASFVGEADGDQAGGHVLAPGDVDGDGLGDLLIAAPHNSELADNGGKVYFVQGSDGCWEHHQPLAGYGAVAGDQDGQELSGMVVPGDLNGDGLPEIALDPGYQNAAPPGGPIVMYSGSAWDATLSASLADLRLSFAYADGSTTDGTRFAVGDIDGDGLDDWAVAGDAYNYGEVHVISSADLAEDLWVPDQSALWLHGAPDAANRTYFDWAGDLNGDGRGDLMARHQDWTTALVLITPADGLPLDEIADDVADAQIVRGQGFGTADLLGDVNGDGLDDIALAVANPEGASDMGTYLFFGRSDWSGTLSIDDADAALAVGSRLHSAAPLGDIDGDGYLDLGATVAGSDSADPRDHYLFKGGPSLGGEVALGDALTHISPGSDLDAWTSLPRRNMLGDLNGDGRGDVLLGASNATVDGIDEAGQLLLFVGRETWEPELSTEDADNRWVGSTIGQEVGTSYWIAVSDINGDGFDDLSMASAWHPLDPTAEPYTIQEGEVFLFFGQAGPG